MRRPLVLVTLAAVACASPVNMQPCSDCQDFTQRPVDFSFLTYDLRGFFEDADLTPDAAVPPDEALVPDASELPDLECPGGVACVPGHTRPATCGNCGTQTDTCGNDCQWHSGMCMNQGVCAPTSTRAASCDPCSEEVCSAQCAWSACKLKPGNACEYQNGTHTRGCSCSSSCSGSALQWCLASCQWSTLCACCTGAGCTNC
jgi:hypothetical protein